MKLIHTIEDLRRNLAEARAKCFGILAGMDFILISTYEADGENPVGIVGRFVKSMRATLPW